MSGRIIYKEDVEIKGYPGMFHKECRFNLKDGFFSITHPKKIVNKDITEVDEVFGKSLERTEELWRNAVAEFESLGFKYERVIMYHIEEKGSYKDGSGEGFVFNWGVFRKILVDDDTDVKYLIEKDSIGRKSINVPYHEIKKWKEIKHTEIAENFFSELSRQVENIYHKLEYFVNRIDIDSQDDIRLLSKD